MKTSDEVSEEIIDIFGITDTQEITLLKRRVKMLADYAYEYTNRNKELYIEDEIANIISDYALNMMINDKTILSGVTVDGKRVSSIKDGETTINFKYKDDSGAEGSFYFSNAYKDLELLLDPFRMITYIPVGDDNEF
jgi:hypothetical protein